MFYRVVERLFVFALLLSSMGVIDGLTRPPSAPASGDWFSLSAVEPAPPLATIVVQLTIYAWGLFLMCSRWRRLFASLRTTWPLLLFVGLAPLSVLWSIEPSFTLRRSALLLFFTTFAIYLGERYSIDELARRLAEALCVMILAVITTHLIAPGYVLNPGSADGAWMGLSGHKNIFGEYMALATVLLLLVRFRRLSWARYVFLLTAAILLLLSHSVAALLDCMLTLAIVLFWRFTEFHRERRVLVLCMIAVLASMTAIYLVTSNVDEFQMLGRDATLSGRTHVWPLVVRAITKHPVLGYGYGTFWSVYKGETLDVWLGAGFLARAADEGYLELCLGFGLVGLVLFACVFARYFAMAVVYLRSRPGGLALWPMVYLVFFALHNLTESTVMQSWRSLPWLIFTAIVTSLALHHRRKRALVLSRISDAPMAIANDWRLS